MTQTVITAETRSLYYEDYILALEDVRRIWDKIPRPSNDQRALTYMCDLTISWKRDGVVAADIMFASPGGTRYDAVVYPPDRLHANWRGMITEIGARKHKWRADIFWKDTNVPPIYLRAVESVLIAVTALLIEREEANYPE